MWKCERCDKENSDNYLFCPYCGSKGSSQKRKNQNGRAAQIIAIILSFVLALCCAGVWLISNRDAATEDISGKTYVDFICDSYTPSVGYPRIILCSDGTVLADGLEDYARSVGLPLDSFNGIYEWTDIVQLSLGHDYILGLKSNGTVVAVGGNEYGQCDVSGWKNIRKVLTGGYRPHSYGLREDGRVEVCGFFLDDSGSVSREKVLGWRNVEDLIIGYGGYDDRSVLAVFSDGSIDGSGELFCADGYVDWNGLIKNVVYADSSGYIGGCVKEDGSAKIWAVEKERLIDEVSEWTDMAWIGMRFSYVVGLKNDGTVIYAADNSDPERTLPGIERWPKMRQLEEKDNLIAGVSYDGHVYVTTGWIEEPNDKNAYYIRLRERVSEWTGIDRIELCNYAIIGYKNDGTVLYAAPLYDSLLVQDKLASGRYAGFETYNGYLIAWKDDGTVDTDSLYCSYGRADYSEMLETVDGWTDIVDVQCTWTGFVGLKNDGTVETTASEGDDYNNHFKNVEQWRDIVQIAAIPSYTYGLRSDGVVEIAGDVNYPYDPESLENVGCIYPALCPMGERVFTLYRDGTMPENRWMDGWSGEAENIVAFDSSGYLDIALRSDGTVITGGEDNYNRIDVDAAQWRDIEKVWAGNNFVLGQQKDGTVVAAGDEKYTKYMGNWKNIQAYCCDDNYGTVVLFENRMIYIGSGGKYHKEYWLNGWENVSQIKLLCSFLDSSTMVVGLAEDGRLIVKDLGYHT